MPSVYPPYIFGMHDRGGEHLMLEKAKRGWVLVTEGIGADPNNQGGSNYTDLTSKELGVIVRLNFGYGTSGTIPHSSQYDNFARRCGNFVSASPGCHIWIIGNEMNLAWERPGGPGGQAITPQLYASCFAKCRDEIRKRPGHEEDQVVVGAVGPWNTETKYPGNEKGDWVQYLADILGLLGQTVDGISLHTYTHGQDPNFVFSNDKMQSPFQKYHWHFRAYRDFMAVIPQALRDRPVYLTETDQYDAWKDDNTGWVRNAYKEIDDWNKQTTNQPIQALILYRWIIGNPNDPREVGWAIVNKPGVQDDFRDAMNREYRVVLPRAKLDYRVAWLTVNAPGRLDRGAEVGFSVIMRNDGRLAWEHTGLGAVRLGYRWIDAVGISTEGRRTDLPQTVAAGGTVTVPTMTVQAPDLPGFYTLELDLVRGADGWFGKQGSPTWRAEQVRVGDRYRVAWLQVAAPPRGTAGETVNVAVRVRNEGSLTWPSDGDNPVTVTYKWLDADRNVVVADGVRTNLSREVAPLEEIALGARVRFPADGGQYILQFDMVHEFVTWFQWQGSPVHEARVEVRAAVPDYAAEWLECIVPPRLVAGQPGSAILEVKNVGSEPWPRTGDAAVRLGYRWFDAQGGEVVVPGVTSRPLASGVNPGDVATFRDIAFLSPQAPGTYLLAWDLIQAGTWLSSKGVARAEQTVQITAPGYGVVWQALGPWPERMRPGEEHHVGLHLENVGTQAWVARGDRPVHLAYHWFTPNGTLSEPWDTFRIRLPHDVPAGGAVDLLDVSFRTPSILGDYILRWDLVEEGQVWFFREGGAPLEVPVEISDRMVFVPWSAQASHNNDDVALAFDGKPDTVWDSKANQEPGMWFQVDLGRVLILDRVRVASPGRGFPVGYKVKLSEDGQDWHLVAESAKNWTDVDEAFAPCSARYVRLEQISSPDWPANWMISEITVSATEAWAGADASHYAGDVGQAMDARLLTAWNTRSVKQKPGMWFKLDMGSLRRVERVVLKHPKNQLPRGYFVEVSADGQDWREVGRKDDNWGELDVSFDPAVVRYIRVETTNSSPYHPWGIAEFVVWRSSPTWLMGREG
jgi:hypothetical protein